MSGQLAMYKGAACCSITILASVPTLFGVIEPFTYSDLRVRSIYICISAFSAIFTFCLSMPKNWREGVSRIGMAGVLALGFTEPVAVRIRPYLTDISSQDGIAVTAAFPACIFIGIVGWFGVAFIVWLFKSPRRIVRFWKWWRNKTQANFDAFLAEDLSILQADLAQSLANEKDPEKIKEILQYFGVALDTKMKGGGQSQSGSGLTLTPSQNPSQEVKSSPSNDPDSKTKTIA